MTGIVYLHDISAPRMTEPPRRRLATFEKLCGSDLPEKVILVTSRTSVNWELRRENYGKNYGGTAETTVDSTAGLDL